MVRVRWIAAVWALAQVQLYDAMPYPAGVRQAAYVLVGVLVVGNLGLWLATRIVTERRATRTLAVAGCAFEVAVASAFVWLYAFDHTSALWVVLFLVPVAAASRFALAGALTTWVAVAGLYVAREMWAAGRYGIELSISSMTFRCGMLALVALVVGLLTRDLVAERERARGLEQWRSRLVAMLAHDIRSPLAAVDMALAGLDRDDDLDRAALVGVARRQTARVLTLARDLLDLAASDQGRLTLHREPTPLTQIVQRALFYTDPNGVIDVNVPDQLVVDVDPGRIEQVLVNLIANATNHGRPPIHITVHPTDDHETVTVEIRDHGNGVPAELEDSLFQAFANPDARSHRDSVGLGLWVAVQLVEAHDGDIAYEQQPDGGACFTLTLPADARTDSLARTSPRPPHDMDLPPAAPGTHARM